tara:strand:+ start:675 stop:1244 length:570 start_codon:yes stop_codon:yes gene_type:complete
MAESDREKWDARYRAGPVSAGDPAWLLEFVGDLPESGRALDIAAGAGRVSIWLARRGFEVSAIDISPVGLALAREAAADEGVQIATHVTDLEREPFPEGPFDLVACFHYRQRALFPLIAANIAPGGVVVAELATVRTLERRPKPSRRWLARPNELLEDSKGLEIVYYREAWIDDRHVARLVARRPVDDD